MQSEPLALLPQIHSEVLVVVVVVRDHLHRRGPSHIGARDGSASRVKEVYNCTVLAHFLDAQTMPGLRKPGTNKLCNTVAQHDVVIWYRRQGLESLLERRGHQPTSLQHIS